MDLKSDIGITSNWNDPAQVWSGPPCSTISHLPGRRVTKASNSARRSLTSISVGADHLGSWSCPQDEIFQQVQVTKLGSQLQFATCDYLWFDSHELWGRDSSAKEAANAELPTRAKQLNTDHLLLSAAIVSQHETTNYGNSGGLSLPALPLSIQILSSLGSFISS